MSKNVMGLYVRDAEGNEQYLSDGRGGDEYADPDPLFRIYAAKVDGSEYYAKNSYGHEFYPVHEGRVVSLAKLKNGREIYIKNVHGDETYPFDVSSEGYFARDANGDKYPIRTRTGFERPPYPLRYPKSAKGVSRYLRDENGRSYYPRDEHGDEYYFLKDPKSQKVLFGTDASGNQIYARDRHGADLYPPDGTFALDLRNNAVYARDRHGNVIFPTDADGNELYLLHLWRPLIDRYAKIVGGSEKYPEFKGSLGKFQFVVGLTYARDEAGLPYYPKGWNGDEYVCLDGAGMEIGYPVSHDGFYLVPDRTGVPELVPGWGVTASDIVGSTKGSGEGTYHITKVVFDGKARTRKKQKKKRKSPWNFTKTALICLFLTLTFVAVVFFVATYFIKM